MKTTYLINKTQENGDTRLSVASPAEWSAAIRQSKEGPEGEKRYFILDYIADGDNLDCMVIEVSYDEYCSWNKRRLAERRSRKASRRFQHLSLDNSNTDSDSYLLDVIPSEEQVETTACDAILINELRQALAVWKPWACELLEQYLQGRKRSCTNTLAKKYNVSPQVMRKYKRQFEEFVKKFLESVSF